MTLTAITVDGLIGAAVPAVASLVTSGQTAIALGVPDLLERTSGEVPPADRNAFLLAIITTIEGLRGTAESDVVRDFNVALFAHLHDAVATIIACREFIDSIAPLLAAAHVHSFAYTGRVDDLGGELSTELAGGLPGGAPGDAAHAITLITTDAATWTALSAILKVTP